MTKKKFKVPDQQAAIKLSKGDPKPARTKKLTMTRDEIRRETIHRRGQPK
jgi:hypothetical protein